MKYQITRGKMRLTTTVNKEGVRLTLEAHQDVIREKQISSAMLKYPTWAFKRWYTLIDHLIDPSNAEAGKYAVQLFGTTYIDLQSTPGYLDDQELKFDHQEGHYSHLVLTLLSSGLTMDLRTEETAYIAALVDDYYQLGLTGGVKELSANLRNES